MKVSSRLGLLCAVVALATAGLGPAAIAGEGTEQGDHKRPTSCVSEAYAAGDPQPASAELACFDSFAEAIYFATDGTVRLPATATVVTQSQLDAGRTANRLASTVIGIEYEDTGFGGQSEVISQVNGCNDGGAEVWLRSDLTGTWMNNEISSARTYAGCKSRHFENANMTGASYLCGCSQMSVMSDRTTSIRWSPSGF